MQLNCNIGTGQNPVKRPLLVSEGDDSVCYVIMLCYWWDV